MKTTWSPCDRYIKWTSRLYQEKSELRAILAVVTIPLLVVLDIFVALMPGPEKSLKFNRAAVFDSWHLQLHNSITGEVPNRDNVTLRNCTHLNSRVVPVNGRHYVHNNGAKSPNEKVETCPLCGDLVKSGWGRCVHCGEVLERNARIPATHNERIVTISGRTALHRVVESLGGKSSRGGSCSLCGDMGRADWERCPRCGESLDGLQKLPVLWGRKATTATQKAALNRADESLRTGEISACPECGDMVKEGWTTCGRCGESLDKLPMLSNPLRSKSLVINRKAVLHCAEKSPGVKTMKTCSLCGDMVRAGSEKCPRCGEPLEGALRLPSLWSRKEVVVDQKPMLP